MRTRDWRRAQREKRTVPAYNRAVVDFNRDCERWPVWWHKPRTDDSYFREQVRYYLCDEGRHWWQKAFYSKRCHECYSDGACDWCLSSRLRSVNRQHEAMDYDLNGNPRETELEFYERHDDDLRELDWIFWCDYLSDAALIERMAFDWTLTTPLREFP